MLENKETYVSSFMEKHNAVISKMAFITYDRSTVATSAYKSLVKMALESAYINYHSKNKTSSYLDSYLFGTLKITNLKIANENKTNTMVCPGCKDNNHIEIVTYTSEGLCCSYCLGELNNTSCSDKDSLSYSIFAHHSTMGFKCPDCSKFIPDRKLSSELRCPYSNCEFVGNKSLMMKMNHPTVKINRSGNSGALEYLPGSDSSSGMRISAQEEVKIAYKVINECIDEQIKTLQYKGFKSTFNTKLCSYKAFKSIMDKFPEEIIPYLSHTGRMTGTSRIQSKVFQELVIHIENSLPFSFIQNGKEYKVESILDEKLGIFAGESVFEAEINEKFEIPNLTDEVYVGSRLGSYCQPYYIGKLIGVYDAETNESIMSNITEYGCTKINVKSGSIKIGTKVTVKHYRVVPHYDGGVFKLINRLKKDIVERVQIRLKDIK